MKPFVLSIVLLTLLSCSAPSADQTARDFLTALAKLDFTSASSYVVAEQKSTYLRLQEIWHQLPLDQQAKFRISDWKITSVSPGETEVTVEFEFDGGKSGELHLVRVGRDWKVASQQSPP